MIPNTTSPSIDNTRKVTISAPNNTGQLLRVEKNVPENSSPYQIVNSIRGQWPAWPTLPSGHFDDRLISTITPIHNNDGISSLGQINEMMAKIEKNIPILGVDGTPNIKLVVLPGNELLSFDGNHTLIAYAKGGKTKLSEMPYLVISNLDYGPITIDEILPFYPPGSWPLVKNNWKEYVVNWTGDTPGRIEKRRDQTIADLAK